MLRLELRQQTTTATTNFIDKYYYRRLLEAEQCVQHMKSRLRVTKESLQFTNK